ncbi:hypothetical protein C7402_101332 [Paraburkholderia unamae]|uniref:Uncharacterized protein n=1 Tax=Paraburkholderia unamae TaxID=219649 RepID=A0ABX5KVC9_9BURK|nr:hypothetical protein C7402_101332 [Paraburkholderia unamae]RAR66958.1 hypothetical protein C7401_102385 [Paraburkholderia unamae]CAG9274516.1 hypothetical protein PUN4_860050 [Paraburkholderia unamae]
MGPRGPLGADCCARSKAAAAPYNAWENDPGPWDTCHRTATDENRCYCTPPNLDSILDTGPATLPVSDIRLTSQ